MIEEKQTVGKLVRAFRKGSQETLKSRLEKAARGEFAFIAEDEFALIRTSKRYQSEVSEKGGEFFLKEWIEFDISGQIFKIKVFAAGSFSISEARVRGYLVKGGECSKS